jgi:hypothetical protein
MRARFLAPLALLALVAMNRPAAASVNLGVGADWIKGGTSEFNLTLGVDSYLARFLSIGGRAGAAFFEDSDHVVVPVDLKLGIHVERVYFEGLVGPWMQFGPGDLFQVHAAFGFGLESRSLAGGLEVGRLEHTTMLGLRLAFKI